VTLTVVTPSHAPDHASFVRLHASVLRHTDATVRHIVAVPDPDVARFQQQASSRLEVVGYRQILPPDFASTTWLSRIPWLPRGYRIAAVNRRRPWPPIRGWILQQIVKLAVVSSLESDVALLVDSDVLVVRPIEESRFRRGNAVRLYRRPDGITHAMRRHRRWLHTARRLLGITDESVDSPDYISAFGSWSPELVRSCTKRVADLADRPWTQAIGALLEFSEYLLVGEFAMTYGSPAQRSFISDRSLCHSHWDPHPLDIKAARAFVDSIPDDDVAIHVQSNSSTPEHVLHYIETTTAAE
jgi:Family of unknown function (DUF6492)